MTEAALSDDELVSSPLGGVDEREIAAAQRELSTGLCAPRDMDGGDRHV